MLFRNYYGVTKLELWQVLSKVYYRDDSDHMTIEEAYDALLKQSSNDDNNKTILEIVE